MQTDEQRLEAIARYEILDTPPEATFDRILAILLSVLDVPGGAITLVDTNRSWYKAQTGMPFWEGPREDNMCDTVILQDGVFVINDASTVPPSQVQPLLKAGIRFYVGAPLRTHDGIKIGTVCAIGATPREVTDREREILVNLAEIVVDEMELRLAARKSAQADKELRHLNDQLAAASRNKSEFLASMSHELRTPLNGILGASELLGQKLFGDLTPRQAEYIADIHQAGMHLLHLIDDVLDLTRVEAGQTQLSREVFDVGDLMAGCAAVVRGMADTKSIQVTVEPPESPLSISADERRITQVACNLLSNALKFTGESGRVLFKAWKQDSEAVFMVEDSGPGIAQEFQSRIFEQFYRVPNDQEGTGLGLPLARQLVELHGGRIWLESEPEQGARFYFSVPLAT